MKWSNSASIAFFVLGPATLQLILAEPITISSRCRGVVASPVALNREHVATWLLWVLNGEVDEIPADTELRHDGNTSPRKGVAHIDLEGVQCGSLKGPLADGGPAALCKAQIVA